MTLEEIAKLDAEVARRGFCGQQARGDWLRAQLGLLPMPDAVEGASHQRVPVPGGQALLAGLGDAGSELRRLTGFLRAYEDNNLTAENRQRLETHLTQWTDALFRKLDVAIGAIVVRFADENKAR